jgi:hypothetical protein
METSAETGGLFRATFRSAQASFFRRRHLPAIVARQVQLVHEVQELDPVLPLEQEIIHTRFCAAMDGRREIGCTAKEAVG